MPGLGVDHRVDRHHVLFERRGDGDDLERGARLVDVLHGAIAPARLVRAAQRIRVERRIAGDRQNLAGLRIEDHDRAPPSARFSSTPAVSSRSTMCCRLLRRWSARAIRRSSARVRGGRTRRRRASVWTMSLPSCAANDLVVGRFEPARGRRCRARRIRAACARQLLVRIEAAALFHEADAFELELGNLARLRWASRAA